MRSYYRNLFRVRNHFCFRAWAACHEFGVDQVLNFGVYHVPYIGTGQLQNVWGGPHGKFWCAPPAKYRDGSTATYRVVGHIVRFSGLRQFKIWGFLLVGRFGSRDLGDVTTFPKKWQFSKIQKEITLYSNWLISICVALFTSSLYGSTETLY